MPRIINDKLVSFPYDVCGEELQLFDCFLKRFGPNYVGMELILAIRGRRSYADIYKSVIKFSKIKCKSNIAVVVLIEPKACLL